MATQLAPGRLPAAVVLGLSPHRLPSLAMPRDPDRHMRGRIDRLLSALRLAGRRAVQIVDANCGDGRALIHATEKARSLGFVAIEAKGFDLDPDQVAAAWRRALATHDPAIGYTFLVLDEHGALPIEDHDADLVLATGNGFEERRVAARGAAIVRKPSRSEA